MKDIQKGEIVQAVVIADSFDSKFGPLTANKPRCLLPLGDRPILSYTLEQLKISGVQECYVYCTSFANAVKSFLAEWVADQGANVLTIHPITNEDCHSFGDAMRDLDAKGILRQDFILTFGDCIGNVNLAPVLQAHKQRAKVDKNATMTMVYRKALPSHQLRTVEEEVFLAINEDKRILYHIRPCLEKILKVPLEAIGAEDELINLKFDLLDPGLAICTQAVPPLFSDNFDCQTLDEFVKGVLQNDLTDNTIYMHELGTDSYAARISNLGTYFAAQHDCLQRWMYPIVPELTTGKRPQDMIYNRHNVYKSLIADIHQDALVEETVLIGASTHIAPNSKLCNTIIGPNCHIGQNVTLMDCVVQANVSIMQGSQISHSAIGCNVKIGKNVVIKEKCVLGDFVELKDNTVVPADTWLISQKPSSGFSDDDDDEEEDEEKGSLYGAKAFLYELEEDEDSEDEDDVKEAVNRWGQVYQHEQEHEDSEDSDGASEISDGNGPELDIDDDDAKYEVFHGEVMESLQRGAKEGVKVDNLVLEVNSSRHAYAITPTQVIHSVLTAILEIAAGNAAETPKQKLVIEVKKAFDDFNGLLAKYIKSSGAQTDCLNALSLHCLNEEKFLPILAKMVHFLYQDDLLQEDPIKAWHEKADPKCREKVKPFIDWLEEDDEDDDEESSESEESD